MHIKIPVKNTVEEHEFRQNVPLRDYIYNSALLSFITTMTVLEICLPAKKPRLEARERSRFGIVKQREAIVPYDWETQHLLVRTITAANEAFWQCHKTLWECRANTDPEHPRARTPDLDTPAVSCLNAVGLALHEASCNIDEFWERIEYYMTNPGMITKNLIDKGFLLNIMNPAEFKKLLEEIGADTI